jgi:hypothetical protein
MRRTRSCWARWCADGRSAISFQLSVISFQFFLRQSRVIDERAGRWPAKIPGYGIPQSLEGLLTWGRR